ncbi:MAG: 1-acyl-sn-glycerol-3-phosphate acyltransferase [Actinomycetia bacterium]|nr:1-acyl-sn-glycerol-3-phosphate acyltransferase [Actinomycetes bacterium]
MLSEWRIGKPFQGQDAPRWGFLKFAAVVVAPIVRWMFRVNAAGFENVPDGPLIISGNHVSYADGLLLWTLHKKYRHQTHFLIKKEIYAIKPLGWLFNLIGSVPVERGTADRHMIAICEAFLKAGDSLAVFPEGRRVKDRADDELGEALSGAAFLAIRNEVPIVPVGIVGTGQIMVPGRRLPRRPKVFIRIGAPLYPATFAGARRERMDTMTAAVMAAIAAQMDEAEIARSGRLTRSHKAGMVVKQKIGQVHASASDDMLRRGGSVDTSPEPPMPEQCDSTPGPLSPEQDAS